MPSVDQAKPVMPATAPQISCSFWRAQLQASWPLLLQGQFSLGVPATHPAIGRQLPLVQTMPAAHGVSSAALAVTAQVWVPLMHEVAPILQTVPGGVHAVPAVHATQVPPLQTRFVPHVLPVGAAVPVSLHTGAPVVHD